MFRARTRVAPPVVMLAFAVGIFGCGGGAAAPAPAEASTQKRPKRKQKALYPKVRAPMPSLEDEVPAAPGTLVRVFRRPVTSGVIEVMD